MSKQPKQPASPPAIPWHHAATKDLAKALGVTARSVELWRKAGAPVGDAAPFDELAVRLWALTGTVKLRAKLADPSPVLAGYLAQVDKLRAAAPAPTDPAQELKAEQLATARMKNAERQGRFVALAREHFDSLLGRFNQSIDRGVVPLTSDLVEACTGKSRLDAEPQARRLVRALLDQAMAAALRNDG